MVRELNNSYVAPLAAMLPATRLGPTGDSPKVYCATCHMGSGKPLNGAQMAKDFPELIAPKAERAQPAAPAAAPLSPMAVAAPGERTLVSAVDPARVKP
jgi:photosynthetic reaction center cytochrome c subunit